MKPLWVFGYGSLIWNPGFAWSRREIAQLDGFHRSFCMWSIHHRGTPEAPGLVLALDEGAGAKCQGIAFEVPDECAEETLEYLRARELISAAYLETTQQIALASGERVIATTYVIDRAHAQYCGGLSLETQAEVIARATGGRGPNSDYLHQTAAHLAELGLRDGELDWLSARVKVLQNAQLVVGKRPDSP